MLEFLSSLQDQDIRVWADGERLRINAPKGGLTPELRNELAARKAEILAFLHMAATEELQIEPVARGEPLPLSISQERFWFLDQLELEGTAYNQGAALRYAGPLDLRALEQSINAIVIRHESLRTTFTAIDGRPVQLIAPKLRIELPISDLSRLPEDEREAEALRLAHEQRKKPFDLGLGPLLRVCVLKLDEEQHILVRTSHHIISDGWSLRIFYRELAAYYRAFSTGRTSTLPELPIQYVDFAAWQRRWLEGGVRDTHLAYWRQRLGGTLPVLELPSDRPRPAIQSTRGADELSTLPQSLVEAARSLGRQEDATLFMTLLAAFKVLLYRHSGQEDILVGSPISGRDLMEVQDLIGLFLNTLVLRTDLSGNPSFRELMHSVRDTVLGAFAHQVIPFEDLLRELQQERNLGHAPLFQAFFVLQDPSPISLDLTGITTSRLPLSPNTAKLDLSLSLRHTEEGLVARFRYSTDIFDAPTIARMAGHYRVLLHNIVHDPDLPISQIPLLTDLERQKLLVDWNSNRIPGPEHGRVHALFEDQVRRTPNNSAVVCADTRLSYQELDQEANQLANYLQDLGVGPEVRVGVFLERSIEMLVSFLGILKAGGVYVPLDTEYPADRLAYMIAEAEPAVLLTKEPLAESLPATEARVVCVDAERPAIEQQSNERLACDVDTKNVAYIIFTSGSTGRPKGVMMPHRALCNRLLWTQRACPVTTGHRVLARAPFSFDGSLRELLWPLISGAQIVLAQKDQHRDAWSLAWLICQEEITHAYLSVSLLSMLLEAKEVDGCRSLQSITTGGEALLPELVERVLHRLDVSIVNTYGPSESPTATTWSSETEGPYANVLLGRPAMNVQVYLLNQSLEPVPVGVSGELYIGGTGLGRGYLDRPGETAERFLPDPFGAEPGSRLYRTGDLARYLPDGNLEFLGRIDHQLKIRGYRVEPGEIEAVLNQHPSIQNSAVVAQRDGTSAPSPHRSVGTRLIAYFVPHTTREPAIAELREFLSEELPDHMVPSAFMSLKALPLTPSGKIGRRSLPAVEWSRSKQDVAYVAPQTNVQQILATVWGQILEIDRVGIHDNFFELGGHSLLATRVISRLRNALRVEIPLLALFEAPTIAGLSEAIIAREERPGQTERIAQLWRKVERMPADEVKRRIEAQRRKREPA